MNFITQISFLSFLLLTFGESLQTRERNDYLRIYKNSTIPPREKRKMSTPVTPSALKKETLMANYLFTISPHSSRDKDLFWRVYFQGQKVRTKEGVFQFAAEKGRDTFEIIVAMIKPPSQITITNMEVPPGIEYIHFKLKRTELLSNAKKYRWHIKEERERKGLTIPEDALIVILDPRYVKGISSQPWEKESDILLLPTLALIDNKSLHETSIKTVLAALDTDAFHSQAEVEKTQTDGVLISRNQQT